ncbi:MAG: exodeoxyribonuclease VII large subunit [Ottowia sp.]|nr:exodeoxyribonuclease VII large subunit [Ottowia sp.]
MAPPVWPVGALLRALGDAVAARFNPVAVRGEVTGFRQAGSGHCYFAIKDASGQLRCALFRRSASLLDFMPRDGDQVEARGRLAVYEARGDLQLVVESLLRAGQGALFEAFLRLKDRLQAEGLFDAERKRVLPAFPRGVGVVTSAQAAALHDILTTLARRAPHVPVYVAPAAVQGELAPLRLQEALQRLYAQAADPARPVDVIVLARGGGSIEDLWAFNDEQLARVIAASPVPVVAGVGHETDFTIADFVADVRAPTPTAAAELVCSPRQQHLETLAAVHARLVQLVQHRLDGEAQRMDGLAQRLGRPSEFVAGEQLRLARASEQLRLGGRALLRERRAQLDAAAQRMQRALPPALAQADAALLRMRERLLQTVAQAMRMQAQRLDRAALRLALLDPQLVLQRGYAWLEDVAGQPVTRAQDAATGDRLSARLADGRLHVTVTARDLR